MIHEESDVIVVAAGMSGLCAAIAAAERGATVTIYEKGTTYGGAASMGMGFFAAGSHIQRANQIDITAETAFQKFMEYTHWRVDARLVKKLFDQSASTITWMESMGVEFLGAYKYFQKSEATWHIVKVPGSNKPTPKSASYMASTLLSRAQELGVQIQFSTPVYEIKRSKTRVTGIRAKREDGTEIDADSDAVIVCTGGFGDNPEMIHKYLGYTHGENLFSFRIPGLTGDGIKMVWAIGGGHSSVNIEMTYDSPELLRVYATLSETMRQPNLFVNLDGKRFINEEIVMNTTFAGNAISIQKGGCAFSIITDEIVDFYRKNGFDYVSVQRGILGVDLWDAQLNAYLNGPKRNITDTGFVSNGSGGQKTFFVANSLNELAAQTGINSKALLKTVNEYNQACASYDRLFHKNPRFLHPIQGKQFFAAKFYPSGYGSLGGIKINDNLEVLTDAGDKIPGLYSAGTDACSIFGDSYDFYFPGSTMGFAINSGRLAGYNAVAYLDSDEFVE